MSADDIFAGSGVAYFAPVGTALPATAVANLNAAFESAGEITEDGLTASFSVTKTVFKNWAGSPVKVKTQSSEFTFTLKFFEDNQIVKELFWGSEVTATNGSTSKIAIGDAKDEPRACVIHVTDGDTDKRFALKEVVAGERAEFQIKPDQAGYSITFHAVVVDGEAGFELFDSNLAAT